MAKTEDLFVAQNETRHYHPKRDNCSCGNLQSSDETTYTTQNLFLVTSDFETGGHYKYKQSLGFNRPMSNITKA